MAVADILTELSAHHAYDVGATDSGVRDPQRRAELLVLLGDARRGADYRAAEAAFARAMLSPERVAAGYGLDDVVEFWEWLNEQ